MNHGDVTDEEPFEDKNRTDSGVSTGSLTVSPPPPHPLGKSTSAMTLEMLVSKNNTVYYSAVVLIHPDDE